MEDKIRVLLTEEEVNEKIKKIGEQISKDYAGKSVHMICVLKGGVFFTCELAKRITVPVSLDFMSVSSYGSETKSSGIVKIIKDLDEPLEGKDVLIVEDIIDSGRTLSYLIEILKKRNPASIRLCTLLDKPERRVTDVKVDYVAFNICCRIWSGLCPEIPQPSVHRSGRAVERGTRIEECSKREYLLCYYCDHCGSGDQLYPGQPRREYRSHLFTVPEICRTE